MNFDDIDTYDAYLNSPDFDRDLANGDFYMSQRNSPDRFELAERTHSMSDNEFRTYAHATYNSMRSKCI